MLMEPTSTAKADLFSTYQLGAAYDEMFAAAARAAAALPRAVPAPLEPDPRGVPPPQGDDRSVDAAGRRRLHRLPRRRKGSSASGRWIPVPRIIPAEEWKHIEQGLVQRLTALNLFLKDIYHDQLHPPRSRASTPQLVYEGAFFRREFIGATGAARHLHPRLRHRPDPRRRRPLPGAGGQRPHPLRASATCCRTGRCSSASSRRSSSSTTCGSTEDYPAALLDVLQVHRAGRPARPDASCCSAPACTTRPTSSTASSPSAWASSWSRGATWSSIRTASSCGRRAGSSAWTSSIAASTTTSSTR